MIPPPAFSEIIREGLWTNNPGVVQLLGLCPLLAVTGTLVNGIGLGLATLAVLVMSNLLVSASRGMLRSEVRIPLFVLIIASMVTTIEMVMNAYFHDLYRALGIFIPLIVTNCTIIGRAEAFASRNDPLRALLDGFSTGLGFLIVLILLGGIREILGYGTLLADAHHLFGEGARDWTVVLTGDYHGFLLAILPPGAFMALGALVALRNWIDDRRLRRQAARLMGVDSLPAARTP